MRALLAVVMLTGCSGTAEAPVIESPPVEVPEAPVEKEDVMIRISDAPASIGVGDTVPLHIEASSGGKNVDPGTVTWETSDSAIAKVDGGQVVGVGPGKAYLTAKSGVSEAMIEVEVVAK